MFLLVPSRDLRADRVPQFAYSYLTSLYQSGMPLQSHPSCQGYRQGIEREINAGNKINEVGRAQDYGMDGRADSGMA